MDVLAYLWGPAADLAFRRGWTHGVLALALWPFLLTGVMLAADRLVRRRRRPESPPALPRELMLLSAVSIISHPILDTLNTYGVRWLMPFSGRWFYGDTLFIVDPWLWLALGAGVLLSRRRTGPARVGLGLVAAYAAAMAVSAIAGRGAAAREIAERTGRPVDAIMFAPRLVTPFVRTVVAAEGDGYRVAEFRWLDRPRIDPGSLRSYARGDPGHPAVVAARATTLGRRFLSWARFPAFQVEPAGGCGYVVHILDLRYADRPGVSFGAVAIPVTLPRTSSQRSD